jgi:hypothetical protein
MKEFIEGFTGGFNAEPVKINMGLDGKVTPMQAMGNGGIYPMI